MEAPFYKRWWFCPLYISISLLIYNSLPLSPDIKGGLVFLPFPIYFIYEYFYFRSHKFLSIKESIASYAQDCNELNAHIEELKKTHLNFEQTDYGRADYIDTSRYRFKRPELNKRLKTQYLYECSQSVCKNAQQQPFRYLCKYFNIKADEETLSHFESVLNDFSAAEQGKILLKEKRDKIIDSIKSKIPLPIRICGRKNVFVKKLGFAEIDLKSVYFPQYTFRYVSPGGNSSINCDILLDIENLEKFILYLSSLIKFRNSVSGQRALMTPALRETIKKRDNYTCQCCNLSIVDEPHLLLEIDHKVPLSKGGITTEDNLQTLCWKCNRSKGSKLC